MAIEAVRRDKPKSIAVGPVRVDEIVLQIENEIVQGLLKPGDRLSEPFLTERFQVGRAPVREAMRLLQSKRLLERVPYAGMRVRSFSSEDLKQLYSLREALEGMAARQAAMNASAECISMLAAVVEDENAFLEDGPGAAFQKGTNDNGFHETIVKISGNVWLKAVLMEDLYTLLRIFRFKSAHANQRLKTAHGEHRAIYAAIKDRDVDLAEEMMRQHVRSSFAHVSDLTEGATPN